MIQIKTLRDLHENGLILEAHCIACLRFVPVDLEVMIAKGKGDTSYIGTSHLDQGNHKGWG